jgi:hypothetical protein
MVRAPPAQALQPGSFIDFAAVRAASSPDSVERTSWSVSTLEQTIIEVTS